MRAPLGWLFHGRLAQRVSTQVMGVPVVVEPNETLRRAIRFEGGDLARFGEEAKVYCQAEKSDLAKSFFSSMTLGLSESANRFETETQFCMLDSDADDLFDHAFLIGTKRAEDMAALAIEPVGYSEYTAVDDFSRENFMRDEGDYIEVVYNRAAGIGGRGINTTAYIGGRPSGATYVRASIPGTGAFPDTPVTQTIPRRLPRPMRFANAEIEVVRHNSRAGELEIEFKRDFGFAVLTLVYNSTTWIIY